MRHCSLEEAVARHVRPGDSVHVVFGHHRWTAAARELVRQHWGTDPGFELVMASLGSLGALFVRGGLLRRVVTAYSGDSFPSYSPNPVFARAYGAGDVAVEHWSFLGLLGRLEAAARGLPAVVTGTVAGTSMAANAGFREVDTPFGRLGLLAPLAPDVALLHAPLADHDGNLALAPPALDGVWGAFAARRGVVATVERVVDDLARWQAFTRIPAHRVLAVVTAPFGAHPGGLYAAPGLPVRPYAEDLPFWAAARDAARGDFDRWAARWCLQPASHREYLARLGAARLAGLRARAVAPPRAAAPAGDAVHPAAGGPVDLAAAPPSPWELAAVHAAREVAERAVALPADAVLAGAGVANLAAWVGVAAARRAGRAVQLTAELGLWGYTPRPGDPSIFNHANFPSAAMLADAPTVLDLLVGGPGTRTVGCLGAAEVDPAGNLNSTRLADGRHLVGAGGGADVTARADESVVVTLLRPNRTPARLGYLTAAGQRVRAVATDRGLLRKDGDGLLRLTAVPAGREPLVDRVRCAVESCGWPLPVDREVTELPPVRPGELTELRGYDPHRLFLG